MPETVLEDQADELVVLVNGEELAGWQKVRVERAMDAASGVFQIDVSSEELPTKGLPMHTGDEVQIRIGRPPVGPPSGPPGTDPGIALEAALAEVLITGFVDLSRVAFGAR